MTRHKITIYLKDGKQVKFTVYDRVPKTAGQHMLMWADADGWFYMVNELEVVYIEFDSGKAS